MGMETACWDGRIEPDWFTLTQITDPGETRWQYVMCRDVPECDLGHPANWFRSPEMVRIEPATHSAHLGQVVGQQSINGKVSAGTYPAASSYG